MDVESAKLQIYSMKMMLLMWNSRIIDCTCKMVPVHPTIAMYYYLLF